MKRKEENRKEPASEGSLYRQRVRVCAERHVRSRVDGSLL